jgi:hypothetical protein
MVPGIKWPVWLQKIFEQIYEGNNLIADFSILSPAVVSVTKYFSCSITVVNNTRAVRCVFIHFKTFQLRKFDSLQGL